MIDEKKNDALEAEQTYKTAVESANDYIENFDILETITNVGNDEVFTPRKTCDMMLDSLPDEVWHNPNYKWLNPATKNGIFEREIAIRLDEGLKDVIPDQEKRRKHIPQNMIYAIGQTKFTANVARRTLYYCSSANRICDGILAEDGHYVNGYAIGNGSWFSDDEGEIHVDENVGTKIIEDEEPENDEQDIVEPEFAPESESINQEAAAEPEPEPEPEPETAPVTEPVKKDPVEQIEELLRKNPKGMKSGKIAELLGVSKRDINKIMYANKDKFTVDFFFNWKLK